MNESLRKMNLIKIVSIFVTFTSICFALPVKAQVISENQFGALLTLEDAIARALNTQEEVKGAIGKLAKAESLYKGSRAEFFPKLKADVTEALATGERTFVSHFDAGIEQPIFQGGKMVARKNRHKTLLESERLKLTQARLDLELGVRMLYIEVLNEKELMRLFQDSVKELSEHEKRIKTLVEKTALASHELFRIETLLLSAKHSLVKHKETYDYALTVLKETVGIGEGESLELEPLESSSELYQSAAEYLTQARKTDPIYTIKDLKVKEIEFEKRELQADRYPHISATAKWNTSRDVYVDTDRFMVGVVGKWDIWDFGRLGSQIKAKSHEIEETKWTEEIKVREFEKEIRRLFHEARSAREKIRLSEGFVREREELYKNEKAAIVAEETAKIDLVDSFGALQFAKMRRLESITEYRVLLEKLSRKIGFKREASIQFADQVEEITDEA